MWWTRFHSEATTFINNNVIIMFVFRLLSNIIRCIMKKYIYNKFLSPVLRFRWVWRGFRECIPGIVLCKLISWNNVTELFLFVYSFLNINTCFLATMTVKISETPRHSRVFINNAIRLRLLSITRIAVILPINMFDICRTKHSLLSNHITNLRTLRTSS